MNAVEHIVEQYFRVCKKCFTIPDVKVIDGNNRQFDLLAYNLNEGRQYHVESSVTVIPTWNKYKDEFIESYLDRKFFGIAEGKNNDFGHRKNYEKSIRETYDQYGFKFEHVNRIWVIWTDKYIDNIQSVLDKYRKNRGVYVEITSLRDEIIPGLQKDVDTCNYEDEVLRTISLLNEMAKQKVLS